MALNITVFDQLAVKNGAMAAAPLLRPGQPAQAVTAGQQSGVITGPALLCLIPDEDQRISVTTVAGYAAPAATGVKLRAGSERYFELSKGAFYLNCVAG